MTLLTLALPCVFAAGCGAPPHVGLALEAFFCSFCAIRPFMVSLTYRPFICCSARRVMVSRSVHSNTHRFV